MSMAMFAALKELTAKVATLEARLAALEAKEPKKTISLPPKAA